MFECDLVDGGGSFGDRIRFIWNEASGLERVQYRKKLNRI